MLLLQPLRQRLMALLGHRQIVEQLSRRGVAGAFRRLDVEQVGPTLHRLGLLAHMFDAERPDQPVGLALVIALHMLAPDQRNALAKALAVKLDQRVAMAVLLLRHFLEHFGRMRKPIRQPVGIGAVDTPVILFGRDGERQDLLLRERLEGTATKTENTGKHEKSALV